MSILEETQMSSKLEARVAQHDREIDAIRKLVLQGMKMLVRIEAALERTDKRVDALAATVDRFIRSLERGGPNGHNRTGLR